MKKTFALLASLSAFYVGSLFAGAGNFLELTDASGSVGDQVEVDVRWNDNSPFSSTLEFRVIYDTAELTFVSCTDFNDSWLFFGCALDSPGVISIGVFDASPPITGTGGDDAMHLFTLTFDVVGSPGTTVVDFDPTFNDEDMDADPILTNDLEAVNTENSTVTIGGGPSYNSTNPAPGVAIDFGSHTAGDPDPTQVMTIDNDGQTGTTLDGSCVLTGSDPGAFTLAGGSFSVPEEGPNDDVTVGCDSSALTPGGYSATLACSHNGDAMPASPVNYALTCTINEGPTPEYGSTPAPGSTIEFGTFTTNDPPADQVVTIENVGNADGLDGACSITTNPNGAYSIDTGANYGPLAQMATAMRTVTCDTSIVGDHDGGVLSCTHNGTAIASPATYTLNCEVTPTPEYSSTPAPGNPLPLITGGEGDADPTTSLSISNVGEAGSTLTGTCSLTGPDAELYIDGGGGFSVLEGDPAAQITVACDATAEGSFSNTLSCTHNDGDGDPSSPVTYAVACEIGPPDPGTWGSNPPSGSTINLTPGGAVAVGTDLTNAGQLEVFNAGASGDEDIDYTCTLTSTGEITQDPSPASGTLVADGPSDLINYSCNTDIAGAFTGSVSCIWSAPIEGINEELYDVTCDVREPFFEVVETPPSGTPQTAEVMPGESHVFTFTFEEILDEGLDGSLDDCTLATGTDFAITDPGSFPQPIPAGGTETVDVTFTDPGVGDTFSDTLTCVFTHNPDGGEPEQTEVSWPLEVNVTTGGNLTILASKNFSDDNPAEVEVTLSCNTGLPLEQTTTISEGDPVNFVVVDFEPGAMDCVLSEVVPDGYEVSYFADIGEDGVAANVFADDEGCHYEGLESADFICEISNELLPVEVVVNKEWVDDNPGFNLPTIVDITLRCENGEVLNGYSCGDDACIDDFIDPSNPGIFGVLPHWDGTTVCSVTEEPEVGVLADVSDCESIALAPGVDGECTIVNTRLFAGIPTLSQYGLLLMALLMLGVGALAFRRYV